MTGLCPSSKLHRSKSCREAETQKKAVEGYCFQAGPGLVKMFLQESGAGSLPQPPPFPSFSKPSLLEVAHLLPFASLTGTMNNPVPGCKYGCHSATCLCFHECSYLSLRAKAGMHPSVQRIEDCLGRRTALRVRGGTRILCLILTKLLTLPASSVYPI